RQFGVLQVDREDRIIGFEEKPELPRPVPERSDVCLVNMGVYIFETAALVRNVVEDSRKPTHHDFGRNVIPAMIQPCRVYAFRFVARKKREQKYGRDSGTLPSSSEASMDRGRVEPLFTLYDKEWPIRTYPAFGPPAKMVFAGDGGDPAAPAGQRIGVAID